MAGFVNSNWQTFAEGTSARLSALRAFMTELANAIGTAGSYSIGGDYSVNKDALQRQYDALISVERFEAEQVGLATGTRLGFTSAKLIL